MCVNRESTMAVLCTKGKNVPSLAAHLATYYEPFQNLLSHDF